MGYKNYGCKVAAAKRMQSCLDQLRAEGIDIGEELEFCESEQESAPLQITCGTATVCDLPPLDAAFSVLVRIIARQSITVDDCQITSPWDGPIRILDLPKPKQDACYRLGTLSCRAEDFLNDKVGNEFTFRRGSIMCWVAATAQRGRQHTIDPEAPWSRRTVTPADIGGRGGN